MGHDVVMLMGTYHDVANICLNLFNLTGPGNYSYVIIGNNIAQFSLVHTYYVTWRQNPFVFHSDFRYQQVSSQIYKNNSPASPNKDTPLTGSCNKIAQF